MNPWRPYPLVRLVIPFVAGILAGKATFTEIRPAEFLFPVTAFLAAAATAAYYLVRVYRFGWVTGALFNLFLLLAGVTTYLQHRPETGPGFVGEKPAGTFLAEISEPPGSGRDPQKAILRLLSRYEAGRWEPVRGFVLCYLAAGKAREEARFGDKIILAGDLQVIHRNANPYVFDYPAWLAGHGITHLAWLPAWAWKKIEGGEPPGLKVIALQARDRLLRILRENRVEGREFAVAAALLLGYTEEIDPELRHDYAATGAMHILSVSGMHVGIIYLFLEFLLSFLDRKTSGRILKALLVLALMWTYAFMTGLSPSVLRSAAMLSFPVAGKAIGRMTGISNVMAASLFCILCFQPGILADAGFQLSFLAVGGIVVFYKPFYDLYVTSSWLPDRLWSLVSVSLAAQLATLPVTLYYFHQFPNYFLLTNILVVPLSSLVIYTGIAALALGSVPVLSFLTSKALVILVGLMNRLVGFVESLPGSTLTGIHPDVAVMAGLIVLIGALYLYLTRPRAGFLMLVLLSLIFLAAHRLEFRVRRLNTTRLVVLNTPREANILFIRQNRAAWIREADTSAMKREVPAARSYFDAWGIGTVQEQDVIACRVGSGPCAPGIPLYCLGRFMQYKEGRVVLLDKPLPKGFRGVFPAGVVIINGNPRLDLTEVQRIFRPGTVVIDATNTYARTAKWLAEATKLDIRVHAVTRLGAFEKDF